MNSTGAGAHVVLFGSGSPLSLAAFQTLRGHALAGVVVPGGPRGHGPRAWLRRRARRRARAELAGLAARAGCPALVWEPGEDAALLASLRRLTPDLICVASFPRLLPLAMLTAARLGTIGLHPSLLPRHRGPDPLFWTYVADDAAAGVSVHHLDAGEDTGDLIAQEALSLARGRPVRDLYLELAASAARLLEHAVRCLGGVGAPRIPQDPARSTREGSPRGWRLPASEWPAERVWHVLSGLGGVHSMLSDGAGRPVAHGRALGFHHGAPRREPGTIERLDKLILHCRDGIVEVEAD